MNTFRRFHLFCGKQIRTQEAETDKTQMVQTKFTAEPVSSYKRIKTETVENEILMEIKFHRK